MSTEAGTIEGEATEVEPTEGADLVPVAPAPHLAVTPQVEAAELVQRMSVIGDAMEKAMVVDVDYGVIPGTNKPALLKPGAEKLGVLFQLDIQIDNEKVWGPDDHLTVMSKATAYYAPTGARLGFGEGLCSTREKKYAKRRADRLCPQCGEATVLESRDRETKKPDGSLFCWKKKGGCGAQFAANSDEAKALLAVKPGDIDNPDIPDTWNTVVKMAEKRARVDAVLAVTGASALFTQDVEEQAGQDATAPGMQPVPAPQPIGRDRAADLLAGATAAGITFGQIHGWLSQRGIQLPEIESGEDALAALSTLTAEQEARFEDAIEKAKREQAAASEQEGKAS